MRKTLIACVITALALGGGTATAAGLFTGSNIANGSLTGADIKDGSLKKKDVKPGAITESRLSKGVRTKLNAPNTTVSGSPGGPGPKGDKGENGKDGPFTYVTDLTGAFEATNPSVRMTPDGAKFGPYPNGGTAGGSVYYSGMNGKKLSDLKTLFYTATYSTDNDTDVAVPYLRIFLSNDDHDVIFSPNTQATKETSEDEPHHWDVTSGSVRYDDDAGNAPDSPWATVVAAHGNETISGIYVTTGFSAGNDLSALLRTLGVNDSVFRLGQF